MCNTLDYIQRLASRLQYELHFQQVLCPQAKDLWFAHDDTYLWQLIDITSRFHKDSLASLRCFAAKDLLRRESQVCGF